MIHFAGLKAVGESVEKPLLYYNNNLFGTVILLEVMSQFGCKNVIHSFLSTNCHHMDRIICSIYIIFFFCLGLGF